jgi:hypothetical protein
MVMIKKQYDRFTPGYFRNFINNHDPEDNIEEALKPYKATIAKSKYKNWIKLNIKWHDEQLYMMFILKWS